MPTQYTKNARPIDWTIDMCVLTTSGWMAETVRPTKRAPAAPKRRGPIRIAPIAAPNATTTNSASRGDDEKRAAIPFRVPVTPHGRRDVPNEYLVITLTTMGIDCFQKLKGRSCRNQYPDGTQIPLAASACAGGTVACGPSSTSRCPRNTRQCLSRACLSRTSHSRAHSSRDSRSNRDSHSRARSSRVMIPSTSHIGRLSEVRKSNT